MRQPPSINQSLIRLDVPGRKVELGRAIVQRLRDAAEAQAGRSTPARDLSLLLDRALRQGTLALRRSELETLVKLTRSVGLDRVGDQLRG
jgi:hypothetical protein